MLNDWQPSREIILSILQVEEELCDSETGAQPIERWDDCLALMAKENRRLLSAVLQGSCAKMCGSTVLIYVRETDLKNRLNSFHFTKRILQSLEKHLEIYADEVRIVAFQDYLPVPVADEVDEEDELPF